MGAQASAVRANDDEQVVQAYIHERFIDLFLSQSRRAQAGQVVSALLVAFIWFDVSTAWWAAGWVVLVLLLTVWRTFKTEGFVRQTQPRASTARVAIVLGMNGALMALPLSAFGVMTEIERAILSIILIALATGSVGTTAGYRSVFLAFAGPMLVPLALAWGLTTHPVESTATAIGLAALVLAFLAFLVSVGKQQYQVFEDSCRIRFAERALNAQLQKALESESEAHRAKTQFLAAASHDLRQPIHSMNVLVAALSMRELEPRAQEITRLLGTVNKTLAAQLDALLDISRLDAGTVEPVRHRQRLDRLVVEHFQVMENTARSKGLTCTLKADEDLPVWTDPALLLRIISNLTDNAIKYNRPGGDVRMQLWRDGDDACLTVSDTGIGIAHAEQDKVFREFYQVDNVERDRTKGLGLGLSIVQRLSALLGIRVSLWSTPGQGTEVTLRMPLALPTAQAAGRAAPAAATSGADADADAPHSLQALQGLRVLLVDDDPQVRQSMELLLTEVGCQVHLATGTAQACDIARGHPLDVLLSDLRLLAGDDGLQVLRAVRAIQPGLRAALITGETAPEQLRQAGSAGVPLLHKPVTLEVLRGVLQPAQPVQPVQPAQRAA
jgi:signal transduction histidine kinase/CheY-like chemotaxis protein